MTGWPRRRLGTALLGFGALGVVLLALLAILLTLALGGLGQAASDLARQRTEAMAMLEPAADALEAAATSASNAGASLGSASTAARRAADLTGRLAGAFDGLALLGSFDLFGAKPFGALTGDFTEVATEARALSTDLATTAAALDANVADSANVAADLRALADQLDRLRSSTATDSGSFVDPASAGDVVRAALVIVLALLAWLAIPAVAAIELGRRWRREPADSWVDGVVDSGPQSCREPRALGSGD